MWVPLYCVFSCVHFTSFFIAPPALAPDVGGGVSVLSSLKLGLAWILAVSVQIIDFISFNVKNKIQRCYFFSLYTFVVVVVARSVI